MNIQRKNSAHHFRMQSEREQTLAYLLTDTCNSFVHSLSKWHTLLGFLAMGTQLNEAKYTIF